MKIRIKCFSQVRYALGKDLIEWELPEGSTTQDLEKMIRKQGGDVLEKVTLRTAVNQHYCEEPVELNEGDEVAFIPPVQGG